MLRLITLTVASASLCAHLSAQTLIFDFAGINTPIPDGDPSGLVDVQSLHTSEGPLIFDLNVTLNISGTGWGGFNGDLYATLQHETGFSVLLNRPGARGEAPQGYSDSGFNVTFDHTAPDIHNYRLQLNGNHNAPISGSLPGAWSPDARIDDPDSVLDTSSRQAFLTSFNLLPINGDWTLFLSDLSPGGTHQLDSWSLSISPIPEPRSIGASVGALLLGLGLVRRLRRLRTRR